MESAHTLVRENTGDSMRRQKRLHDKNLSYNMFEVGDRVYVYFPVKKVGCSSKLTSYWRGPYEVIDKLTDVLYKVNCGRAEKVQVIHCDRMRRAKNQVLAGEDVPVSTEEQEVDVPDVPECYADNIPDDPEKVGFPKRRRTKPAWMADYVLSTFSMVNTKMTARKPELVCPSCRSSVQSAKFKYHVLTCVGKEYGCDQCTKTFKKKAYLVQHNKRKHGSEVPGTSASAVQAENQSQDEKDSSSEDETSDEEDWQTEPNVEIGEDIFVEQKTTGDKDEESVPTEDIQSGRTIRKRTSPVPVPTPKKKRVEEAGPASCGSSQEKTATEHVHKLDMKLLVDVNEAGRKKRSLQVEQDKECVLEHTGYGAGSLRINLGEFVEKGVKIDPSDVCIEISGTEANISVSYRK